MKETRLGSPNGRDVYCYCAGKIYLLPPSLAGYFIRSRYGLLASAMSLTASPTKE